MKSLNNLFKFYIDSSIHVALAVCALCAISSYFLEVELPSKLLGFVFFSTITGYNFVKYAGIAKLHHRSLTNNLKIIQVFSFACFIVLFVLAFFQTFQTLLISGVLGLFTALYAIPFLPQQKNLRSLKSIKIFVIALVWAGTSCLLPLKNLNYIFNSEIILHLIQVFVFVLALIIPFEIRDLNYDKLALKTFPQLIGIKKTKIAGYLLLLVFIVLGYTINNEKFVFIPTLIIAIITAFAIVFSTKKQSQYYASFWVEAIPIVWLILLWMFN
jgi:hypothetical protein